MEAVVRKQTSFRLREDLLQILQEQAKKANRSLNNFVESTLMDAVYSCLLYTSPSPRDTR